MLEQIAWNHFDWQSFATLATGTFAVAAAALVGIKQTRIQEQQATLQQAEVRTALFERRYKIFDVSEKFIIEILQKADDPTPETERAFVLATGQARFLFEPEVHFRLREIYKRWAEFHALKMVMDHSYRTAGHYGEGNSQKQLALLEWFQEALTTLPDTFHEIRP